MLAAVKELLENALDAKATNIEVRLRDHGSTLIEVADNGTGVPPADYQALTLKYHTSKINDFIDLAVGARLEFDREGRLVVLTPCPRAVGTTVAVKELFSTLPVRRKEFLRCIKREYTKLHELLQAYAVISTQVRLVVSHQSAASPRTVLLNTPGCSITVSSTRNSSVAGLNNADASTIALAAGHAVCTATKVSSAAADSTAAVDGMRSTLMAVFGTKMVDTLEPIQFEIKELGVEVTGYISRSNTGSRGESLKQYTFINGRPVDLPKVVKILNDVFKSLGSALGAGSVKPFAALSILMPRDMCDVNVTPDKRKVFMQSEAVFLEALEQALRSAWEPSRYTFSSQAAGGTKAPSSTRLTPSGQEAAGRRQSSLQRSISTMYPPRSPSSAPSQELPLELGQRAKGKSRIHGKGLKRPISEDEDMLEDETGLWQQDHIKLVELAPAAAASPAAASASAGAGADAITAGIYADSDPVVRSLLGSGQAATLSPPSPSELQYSQVLIMTAPMNREADAVPLRDEGGPSLEQMKGHESSFIPAGILSAMSSPSWNQGQISSKAQTLSLGASPRKMTMMSKLISKPGLRLQQQQQQRSSSGNKVPSEADAETLMTTAAVVRERPAAAAAAANDAETLMTSTAADVLERPAAAANDAETLMTSTAADILERPAAAAAANDDFLPTTEDQSFSNLNPILHGAGDSNAGASMCRLTVIDGPLVNVLNRPSVLMEVRSSSEEDSKAPSAVSILSSTFSEDVLRGGNTASKADTATTMKDSHNAATEDVLRGGNTASKADTATTMKDSHNAATEDVLRGGNTASKADTATTMKDSHNAATEDVLRGGNTASKADTATTMKDSHNAATDTPSPASSGSQLLSDHDDDDEGELGQEMPSVSTAQPDDNSGLLPGAAAAHAAAAATASPAAASRAELVGDVMVLRYDMSLIRKASASQVLEASLRRRHGGADSAAAGSSSTVGSGGGADCRKRKHGDAGDQLAGLSVTLLDDALPAGQMTTYSRRFRSSSLQAAAAAFAGGSRSRKVDPADDHGGAEPTLATATTSDAAAAERELERVFRKKDFAEMEVVGQFNLGFILAVTRDRELFIIDQHAADEKTNFERMQRTLVLNRQPLIAPIPIPGLTLHDEELIREHRELFKKNGFEFVDEIVAEQRLQLAVSKVSTMTQQQQLTDECCGDTKVSSSSSRCHNYDEMRIYSEDHSEDNGEHLLQQSPGRITASRDTAQHQGEEDVGGPMTESSIITVSRDTAQHQGEEDVGGGLMTESSIITVRDTAQHQGEEDVGGPMTESSIIRVKLQSAADAELHEKMDEPSSSLLLHLGARIPPTIVVGSNASQITTVNDRACFHPPSSSASSSAPRLLLSSVPFSKGVTFSVEDVLELVSLLKDSLDSRGVKSSLLSHHKQHPATRSNPEAGAAAAAAAAATATAEAGDSVIPLIRPSKVRSMLASRACRSSIMIGKPLDRPAMKKVLRGMSVLEQPWNCPHGRPTMRHVVTLPTLLHGSSSEAGRMR
ncbi:hypothetical protein CEUSTIGMA_g1845.t1 [Chlamydomonas eustigma]|uniref:DNA mismatch repair protein S5 domain-containing protein n=1 Tax=Chlamydomonas eustigma TaxID=1157962 RepID=A0A250WU98_9CHLO|nr:hypothetical protein CEUSTIGMA_g1845.t1 [Chlamydomonas eustigma]|eukprot:GAX74397.1 hypothetical protein CEUSTIGMA_g1845.t1 [Chlamydomonas eustigma]